MIRPIYAPQRLPRTKAQHRRAQLSKEQRVVLQEFVRRPFRRGGHSLATGRPPWPKRLLSGRQSKVLQRPRKYDPAATTAGTRGTEVEEGEQPTATDVEPEQEGLDEAQAESGSKARTPSQNLWGQTPQQLVNSQEPSFTKATTSQHQAGTVQEYSTGWEPASWYQASTTHGTSAWVP